MIKTQYIERLKHKGYKIINEDQVSLGTYIFDIQEGKQKTAMGIQNTFCLVLSANQGNSQKYKAASNVQQMKRDGITFAEIQEELEYRDKAAIGCRWNDNLFEYSYSELKDIANLWIDL